MIHPCNSLPIRIGRHHNHSNDSCRYFLLSDIIYVHCLYISVIVKGYYYAVIGFILYRLSAYIFNLLLFIHSRHYSRVSYNYCDLRVVSSSFPPALDSCTMFRIPRNRVIQSISIRSIQISRVILGGS